MASSSAMEEAVIVDLQTVANGGLDTDCTKISCSGTFIDKDGGLIITSGLILSPVLQIKADLQEEYYHPKLLKFFGEHGSILCGNQFVADNTYLTGQPLLNYIETLCNVKVYVQNHQRPRHDTQPFSNNILYSNCLLSFGKKQQQQHVGALDDQCNEPQSDSASNTDKSWIKLPAKILIIWRCPSLANILEDILVHGSGWSLTDDTKNETGIEEQLLKNVLPFFVLLKVKPGAGGLLDDYVTTPSRLHTKINQTLGPYLSATLEARPFSTYSTFQIIIKLISKLVTSIFDNVPTRTWKPNSSSSYLRVRAPVSFLDQLSMTRVKNAGFPFERFKNLCDNLPSLRVGDQLYIMATPFGSLSPNVFINSISKGILTNVAGENDVLLLTDARCVPGCEGGAIYAQSTTSKRQLIGLIIAPFCWRQNEWVGLTFGIHLRPLLESLFLATGYDVKISGTKTDLNRPLMDKQLSDLVDSVALIKVGSRWGSAVLLNLNQCPSKYLITCCHVVQQTIGSTVKVHFHSQKLVPHEFCVDATVIYCTPQGRIYDIAILEIRPNFRGKLPAGIELSPHFAVEGGQVLAVGHGLFDDSMQLPASVTSGIISKILGKDGKQVLIQSTCAVHPGASGGALLNSTTKQICGIIVCNTKDAICGASYPHINLSIPSTIILPALKDYIKCGDPKVLDCLHDPDPVVACFWQLGYNQMGKLHCKL